MASYLLLPAMWRPKSSFTGSQACAVSRILIEIGCNLLTLMHWNWNCYLNMLLTKDILTVFMLIEVTDCCFCKTIFLF